MTAPIPEPDIRGAQSLFQSLNQIHLVAILPDGPAYGRDFGLDCERALSWARQQNESGRNIYFTVNEVQPGHDRKPTKAKIKAARFVHVDIDPPNDGSHWEKGQALLEMQKLPSPPSFILDSGNGLQAFWRLATPDKNCEGVERLNMEIARQLGGDACHNIDRLMRVPGFVNFPNAAKRRRGRVPISTSWDQADSGVKYTLEGLETAFARGHADEKTVLLEWRRQNERLSDEELIARCQHDKNWHDSMRDLIARLVVRGKTDAEILTLAPHIALSDFTENETRADMLVAIRGARKKWSIDNCESYSAIKLELATSGDLATVKLEYLIDPYLPRNCVVGFNGRGGSAKSSFLASVAASISNTASTLWISVEELSDWIRVRHIKSGGADKTLAVATAVPTKRDQQGRVIASSFDIYEHLETAIIQASTEFQQAGKPALSLVVLDTAVGLTGWAKGESPNDDASVKRLLGLLQTLAERHGVTIAFIHHANKQKHDHFADAVAGSSAWTNSPRLSFILAGDRHEEYSFVIRTAKSNLTQPFAARYRTTPVHILHERENGADSVLCQVEPGPITWGADASLELFDMATRKLPDDEGWSRPGIVEEVAQAVARLVQNSDQPITREVAESNMARSVSRGQWKKIDGRLAQLGIAIKHGEHNRTLYEKDTQAGCCSAPLYSGNNCNNGNNLKEQTEFGCC